MNASKINLPFCFPSNNVGENDVVITHKALEHLISNGQYKKFPKLTMEYIPKRHRCVNGVTYIYEIEVVGFSLEDEI